MDYILDLSGLNTNRYFIMGDVCGDYTKMMNILYYQRFTYKDTFIFTGNIINPENQESLNTILFLKNIMNAYSVKGKEDFNFINNNDYIWFNELPNKTEIISMLSELPLVIKISDTVYVVNSGIEPTKSLHNQNPEVFYNIGKYDKDSRFYQFENPDQKSWYEFDIFEGSRLLKFCFGGTEIPDIEVTAGYGLGRDNKDNNIKCLIFKKGDDLPILIA